MKKEKLGIPVRKNEEYTMTIDDISTSGEGIGKIKGYTLFLKGALPGDEILVKVLKTTKKYGFGKLIKILKPSSSRVEPICPIAGRCGGCQLLHYKYDSQLEYKRNKVKNALERIGGITDVEVKETIGMEEPYYYRNKVQYPVGLDKDKKVQIGFYAIRSHTIVESKTCYIQNKFNDSIIQKIKEYIDESRLSIYSEQAHQGLLRHIVTRIGYYTKEIMVCLVVNGESIPNESLLVEKLRTIPHMKSILLNTNKKKSNVILGEDIKCLWGKETITDDIGDIKYKISLLSFYQVNPIQTKKLYDKVLEYVNPRGNETIWDIYCGIGTIGLYLARHVKQIYGIEIIPQAIEDAKENARINHIKNAEFYVGKAEEILPKKHEKENIKADIIIIDPPRKGCDQALLETLIQIKAKKIIYVSCDPATLARDLKILTNGGYAIVVIQPLDMFAHSVHVETVALMSRTEK